MVTRWTVGAERLLDNALAWLGRAYGQHVFYVERDVVFTLQTKLVELATAEASELHVYNDYPMVPGTRRSLSTDLAVISPNGSVEVAVEFKYEPCHRRADLLKNKLPVTVWSDIVKDTERVRRFVEEGRAQAAAAICIDEGGYLIGRDLSIYAQRQRWPGTPSHTHDIEALIFHYPILAPES